MTKKMHEESSRFPFAEQVPEERQEHRPFEEQTPLEVSVNSKVRPMEPPGTPDAKSYPFQTAETPLGQDVGQLPFVSEVAGAVSVVDQTMAATSWESPDDGGWSPGMGFGDPMGFGENWSYGEGPLFDMPDEGSEPEGLEEPEEFEGAKAPTAPQDTSNSGQSLNLALEPKAAFTLEQILQEQPPVFSETGMPTSRGSASGSSLSPSLGQSGNTFFPGMIGGAWLPISRLLQPEKKPTHWREEKTEFQQYFPSIAIISLEQHEQQNSNSKHSFRAHYLDSYTDFVLMESDSKITSIAYAKNRGPYAQKEDIMILTQNGMIIPCRMQKAMLGESQQSQAQLVERSMTVLPYKMISNLSICLSTTGAPNFKCNADTEKYVCLAFDPQGQLYCSVVPLQGMGGKIYRLDLDGRNLNAKLFFDGTKALKNLSPFDQAYFRWGGHFTFDYRGFLWLSSGSHSIGKGLLYKANKNSAQLGSMYNFNLAYQDDTSSIFDFALTKSGDLLYIASDKQQSEKGRTIKHIQFLVDPFNQNHSKPSSKSATSYIHFSLRNAELLSLDIATLEIKTGLLEKGWKLIGEWKLKEEIEKKWTNELVSFQPGSITCQSDEEFILIDKYNREISTQAYKGQIYFIVDELMPLDLNTYRLFCRSKSIKSNEKKQDLQIIIGDSTSNMRSFSQVSKQVTLKNKLVEAVFNYSPNEISYLRKPLMGLFDGPLISLGIFHAEKMHDLASSRMFGLDKLISFKSELEAEGPVFAQINFTYVLEGTKKTKQGEEQYQYELHLTARLAAGDSQIRWTSEVKPAPGFEALDLEKQKQNGWRLVLKTPKADPLIFNLSTPQGWYDAIEKMYTYNDGTSVESDSGKFDVKTSDGVLSYGRLFINTSNVRAQQIMGYLSPWNSWLPDIQHNPLTQFSFLRGTPGQREPFFKLTTLHSEDWVEPQDLRKIKSLPPFIPTYINGPYLAKGTKAEELVFKFPNTKGKRVLSFGSAAEGLGYELDIIHNHYKLDWSEISPTVPMTINENSLKSYRKKKESEASSFATIAKSSFLNLKRDMKDSLSRSKLVTPRGENYTISAMTGCMNNAIWANLAKNDASIIRDSQITEILSYILDLVIKFDYHTAERYEAHSYVRFSYVYQVESLIYLYDLWRTLFPEKDLPIRRLMRAKMAYFIYKFNRAEIWSTERGYGPNDNFHYRINFNRGVAANLFPNHPEFINWQKQADDFEPFFFDAFTEKGGETKLNDVYSLGVLSHHLFYILSQRDATRLKTKLKNDRFKKYCMYLLRHYSAKDPRFEFTRRSISYNRSNAGERIGLSGLLAQLYRDIDAERAMFFQKLWEQEFTENEKKEWKTASGVLLERADLGILGSSFPYAALQVDTTYQPRALKKGDLDSTANKNFIIFQHGDPEGKSQEEQHQMMLMTTKHRGVDQFGYGGIKSLFAYGQPIMSQFGYGVGNSTARERLSNLREGPLRSRVLSSRRWMERTKYKNYGDVFLIQDFVSASQSDLDQIQFVDMTRLNYASCQSTIYIKSKSDCFEPISSISAGVDTKDNLPYGVFPGNDPGALDKSDSNYQEKLRYCNKLEPHVPIWPTVQEANILKLQGKERTFTSDDTKLQWQRQLAFIKDDDPANGVHYYVFRDTVTTKAPANTQQPSEWTMWTLSRGLYGVNDKNTPILDIQDTSGLTLKPRPLSGQRFFAYGQRFNKGKSDTTRQSEEERVDIEYFVANPDETPQTPRHTLHWGTKFKIQSEYRDYQDLLHLQLPGDGHYFVVAFPRRNVKNRPIAPDFKLIGNEKEAIEKRVVIQISGTSIAQKPFIDFVFMADNPTTYSVTEVTLPDTSSKQSIDFSGKMASIQFRNNKIVALCLASVGYLYDNDKKEQIPGRIEFLDYKLESLEPCSLVFDHEKKEATLELAETPATGKKVIVNLTIAGQNQTISMDKKTAVISLPKPSP